MKYAICIVPAAPVRAEAAHRSEMTNQLLFGETMMVLEAGAEWLKIRSLYDAYEGWITVHLAEAVDEATATAAPCFLAAALLNTAHFGKEPLHLPMGAALTGFSETNKSLWNSNYQYNSSYINVEQPAGVEVLLQLARQWLNAPYLWGGKTILGVDCSGFIQTVFKMCGISLKRDAWQQAQQGNAVDFDAIKPGDVVFFHNQNGKIIHVGLALSSQYIIHASGKVRIDVLDEKGIVHAQTGKQTHYYNCTRRFF